MQRVQIVENKGIYHGLPSYTEDDRSEGLTALVTGSNGVSGFHMVKVLAAAPPGRWKHIFCLSRRPPPDYFLEQLGEGASKVECVAVDFLDEPSTIAESLRQRIKKIDHVFFFSYVQPKQTGGVTSMWSNADMLTEANVKLLRNFLDALNVAALLPKRILLQAGAKQYGCHIGPFLNPAFEEDPRVLLESNFYYPQEDMLFDYCKERSISWNVVRPSYITGAVRDNLLNHMVGLAVYAAVQAHLGRPLLFPADYICWDKEVCQSTAMLNAYFMEYTVLTDIAANEAFNIQDGLPFTWGRFWPYLASWYGTTWQPPEADESKYRSSEARYATTPRGYGKGMTRFMFTLQEWSEGEDIMAAWDDLTKTHNLQFDPFKDRAQTFGVADSAIVCGWPLSLSVRKARKFGFHGTVDSLEAAFETLQGFARIKVSVPMVKERFEEVC